VQEREASDTFQEDLVQAIESENKTGSKNDLLKKNLSCNYEIQGSRLLDDLHGSTSQESPCKVEIMHFEEEAKCLSPSSGISKQNGELFCLKKQSTRMISKLDEVVEEEVVTN